MATFPSAKARLGKLLRGPSNAPKVSLPTLTQLGYQPPNRDGSLKSCASCPAWVSESMQCRLHDEDETVTDSMVCNHYVMGDVGSMQVSVKEPLTPKTSGLSLAGSCADCQWYESQGSRQGACLAAMDDALANDMQTSHPTVLPKGLCNRFEER